jgi:arylsulfatase A-like enzyme
VPSTGGTPYDVLIFTLDDVAMADLELGGGPVQMPYLARLAARGVVFRNAYANAVCATTRRSLNYGRFWLRGNGGECETPTLDTPALTEVSLAEALPGHAGLYVGKWHLGAVPGRVPWECAPIARGYDAALALTPSNVAGGSSVNCSSIGYREWLAGQSNALGCASTIEARHHALVVRDVFRSAWRVAPRPLLANVNSNLAHAPFHRPPASLLPPGYPATGTERERYEAMLRALDTTLGQMLAGVDLTRTLVIVVGDNGTPDTVAPESGRAKNTTFERGIRVPLVIAGGPVTMAGVEVDDLVHVVDLHATAIEAGGGDPALSPDGVSLIPILTGARHAPLRDFVLCGSKWGSGDGDRCAVSRGGFKLRQIDFDADRVPDREELYDLRSDPRELHDLIGLSREADALRAWIDSVSP